jgi:hypothetical protein
MTTSDSTRRSSIVVNNPSTMQEREAEAERVARTEAGDAAFNIRVGSTGYATGPMSNLMRWTTRYASMAMPTADKP